MVKTVTCHNPYFIGMNLAMIKKLTLLKTLKLSQSLFYWNEPCNNNGFRERIRGNKDTILILLE